MDRFAYILKEKFPRVFNFASIGAGWLVKHRFGAKIALAKSISRVEGGVDRLVMARALQVDDFCLLEAFIARQAADRLKFFNPHPFDESGLLKVLTSKAYMPYGIFIEEELAGYGLLKVSPTGSAFIGLLVDANFGGSGLGKFIIGYLYWQASVAGLRTRSTISRQNIASLYAHQAVSDYEVIVELPNDYIMIEFPNVIRHPPELSVE